MEPVLAQLLINSFGANGAVELPNIDKDENENEELIHTSLMTGKSLNDSRPQNARTEEEADFTLGGGGVRPPITCE